MRARDARELLRRWRSVPAGRARDLLGSMRTDIDGLLDLAHFARRDGNVEDAEASEQHAEDLRTAHNALAAIAFLDDEVLT